MIWLLFSSPMWCPQPVTKALQWKHSPKEQCDSLHYLENILYFCVLREIRTLQRRWNCLFILEYPLFSGLTANQYVGKNVFFLQQWKEDSVQRTARNDNISSWTWVLSKALLHLSWSPAEWPLWSTEVSWFATVCNKFAHHSPGCLN